jgi:hypothetical protein
MDDSSQLFGVRRFSRSIVVIELDNNFSTFSVFSDQPCLMPTLKKLHSFPDTYGARLGGTDLAHPSPVTRILAILIKLSGFQEE